MDGFGATECGLKACLRMLVGMLQATRRLTERPAFGGLFTLLHVLSCGFVQSHPTSLQSTAKTYTFTWLTSTHKRDWLQCSPRTLASQGTGRSSLALQRVVVDEDRVLHAMQALATGRSACYFETDLLARQVSQQSRRCSPILLAHTSSRRRGLLHRDQTEENAIDSSQ